MFLFRGSGNANCYKLPVIIGFSNSNNDFVGGSG